MGVTALTPLQVIERERKGKHTSFPEQDRSRALQGLFHHAFTRARIMRLSTLETLHAENVTARCRQGFTVCHSPRERGAVVDRSFSEFTPALYVFITVAVVAR